MKTDKEILASVPQQLVDLFNDLTSLHYDDMCF